MTIRSLSFEVSPDVIIQLLGMPIVSELSTTPKHTEVERALEVDTSASTFGPMDFHVEGDEPHVSDESKISQYDEDFFILTEKNAQSGC